MENKQDSSVNEKSPSYQNSQDEEENLSGLGSTTPSYECPRENENDEKSQSFNNRLNCTSSFIDFAMEMDCIYDPNKKFKNGKLYAIIKRYPNDPKESDDSDCLIELDLDAEEIDLNHCRVVTTKNFETLTKPVILGLRNNLLTEIECLGQMINLRELDLYDNQLTKINNLDQLVNLEILDLSFNRIRKIEGLDTLVNLKKLFLINNKIEKIENLDRLVSLEMLELGDNKIRKIENLDKLSKLTSLFIGKNKIAKLENLDSLKELNTLSIQSNRILKIEGLDNLENLTDLYISHNGITVFEGLDKLKKLNTLDVAGNKIKHLENIGHLTELAELWANDNLIENWNYVDKELSKLKQLTTVYLERNPLASDPMYRKKLMLIAPNLTQIDATMCR